MSSSSILEHAQAELRKHGWDTFVDDPPSMANGGKGVVTPGCPACRKRLYRVNQFLEHIAVDVLPGIVDGAMQIPVRRIGGTRRSSSSVRSKATPQRNIACFVSKPQMAAVNGLKRSAARQICERLLLFADPLLLSL